jgi:hypothetical protein
VKEELVYIGVDIAKSHLDAAIGAQKHRFCNAVSRNTCVRNRFAKERKLCPLATQRLRRRGRNDRTSD